MMAAKISLPPRFLKARLLEPLYRTDEEETLRQAENLICFDPRIPIPSLAETERPHPEKGLVK